MTFDLTDVVDGGILLGASGLTGRYWLGSLWYYANPDAAPDVEKCTAGVQLEAGFQEAVWLDNTKVLVGLDTGNALQTDTKICLVMLQTDTDICLVMLRPDMIYVSVIQVSLNAIYHYSLCFHCNKTFTFDFQTLSIAK